MPQAGGEKAAELVPEVQLQEHQQRIADRVSGEDPRMLVYHGLGSGKSLSAIAAAEAAKKLHGGNYGIVVPASLRGNFQKEIGKFTRGSSPEILSYTGLGSGKQFQETPDTLIMDEAARLRNPNAAMTRAALQNAGRAKRVMLLTGTPITNEPKDLASLISIIRNQQYDPAQFDKDFVGEKRVWPSFWGFLQGARPGIKPVMKNGPKLRKLLEGHVDYQPSKTPEGVNVNEETVNVPLSREQQRIQKAIRTKIPPGFLWKLDQEFPLSRAELAKLNSFMTGLRQVSLSTQPFRADKSPLKAFSQSAKLQEAFKRLRENLDADPRRKAIIYSNFVDAGLGPYAAGLEANKIPHGIFHGGIPSDKRQQALRDYNEGKLRALLIGPAGAEGLSTKGTSLIQLLDPYWNESRLQQARGRGLRFDSHEGLPEDLKNVAVQRYLSTSDEPTPFGKLFGKRRQRTGDEVIQHMSGEKEKLNEQFRQLLREVGTRKQEQAQEQDQAEKEAALGEPALGQPAKPKKKARMPWLIPGLAGAGALSAGAAYGMASDNEIANVRNAVQNYDPAVFTQNAVPENQTGLTYYQKTLSPAAQLKPFGVPVGDLLVKLRSSPQIMKALNTENYLLKTPTEQAGVGGMAHYNMFSNGPVAAYAHQLKARLSDVPVPERLGVPANTRYSDWMGRKFEDFVASRVGQRINPFEFTPKFMGNDDQAKLMEDFYKSLPPEQQKFRVTTENPGPAYAAQTGNYLPKAKAFADVRDKAKQLGFMAGGGAAGGALGHYFMRKRKNTNPLAYWASVLGGTGLGAAASHYGSTPEGRAQLSGLYDSVRNLARRG